MSYVFMLFMTALMLAQPLSAQTGPALTLRIADRATNVDTQMLARLTPRQVEIESEGVTVRYDGVRLRDLLDSAGVRFAEALRGRRLADYVVTSSADGYRVVFALAEIDPQFSNRDVLIVTRRNGGPLPAEEGPFRLLVPGDIARARWARQLTTITVASVPEAR